MKLLRYGAEGAERPAVLDGEGRVRDLSPVLSDIRSADLGPASLAKLKAVDPRSLPVVHDVPRIGRPVADPGKVICVGLNFRDHAAETGAAIPVEPVLFGKWAQPTGPDDPIVLPRLSVKTDWEVELGVVIGSVARYVPEHKAFDCIAGYCVVNDVSERDYQMNRGGTWDKGKGCDSFCPMGPWLVTGDEVGDPQDLAMWLDVNGKRFQNSSTREMVFNIPFLIHYISQFTTLHPGDLIVTGTPAGVGLAQSPPVFLKPGDTVRLGIEGLGTQTQMVRAWDAADG